MPEMIGDRERRARESAGRVAKLRAEVQLHHEDADIWYGIYEGHIVPDADGRPVGSALPVGAQLAYQRAAHHTQARAAAAAEAVMEMVLAHLAGRS